MKKQILLVISAVILLSSCSAKKENKEQIPSELKLIKNHFSAIYKLSLSNKNEETVPNILEEETLEVSSEISFIANKNERSFMTFDKNHYYLKECLESMEEIRINLAKDDIETELINGLDNSVNRLVHYINEKNNVEAMRAANDGIYIIGVLSKYYDQKDRADMLKFEYCLNLIEIESYKKEELNNSIDLAISVLSEVSSNYDERQIEWERIRKSLDSIKEATKYSDGRLIRMKVGIIRENLKKIDVLE